MESSKRLAALDVFRGLTIALMIIVNNPGSWDSVYPPLLHSVWNGCTPTDLVFPFFMFIIGAAMWYSYKKSDHKLTGTIVLKILRRTVIIYLIGISLNAYAVHNFCIPRVEKIPLSVTGSSQHGSVLLPARSMLLSYMLFCLLLSAGSWGGLCIQRKL